jgi:hypothetical protein
MFAKHPHLLTLTLICLLAFPFAVGAQHKRPPQAPVRPGATPHVDAPPKSVKVLIPDLITGEKVAEAAMDYNTFKLGLAPGAVVMVEFPARDSILRVHPGDQNLVTVDDTDTAPNYPLIFRPGDGFVVSKTGSHPFALITVQMASGIPFVFQVYPVASINDSASHVVVRYDRDKVVAARRSSGLPVNYKPVPLRPGVYAPEETLDQTAGASPTPGEAALQPIQTAAQPPPQLPATPALAATPTPTPVVTPAVVNLATVPAYTAALAPAPTPLPARIDTARNLIVSPAVTETPRPLRNAPVPVIGPRMADGAARILPAATALAAAPRPVADTSLAGPLRDYMKQVVADAKVFSKYTKPLYGLSVAVSRPKDHNLDARFIVIAVKNTLTEAVRLVPGQPDLFVETLDDKQKPVLVEPIQKIGLETTAPLGDLLAPGATAYYAVAFTPPVLGTHQYLRISVAQTTAADAPSSVDLTIKSR